MRLNLLLIGLAFGCLTVTAPAQERDGAVLRDLLGQGGNPGLRSRDEKIALNVELTPDPADPANQAVLAIHAELPSGFFIYSTSLAFDGGTRIQIDQAEGLTPLDGDFTPDRNPKRVSDPFLKKDVEKFFDRVTWTQRFRIKDGTELSQARVAGTITGSYCSTGVGGTCKQIYPPWKFQVAIRPGSAGGVPSTTFASSATSQVDHAVTSDGGTAVTTPFVVERTPTRRIRGGIDRPDPVHFKLELTPVSAQPGDEVELRIAASLDGKWHIFALTQDPEMAGLPTVISTRSLTGLEPIDEKFTPSNEPETVRPLDNIVQIVHHDSAVWTRRYRVTEVGADSQFGLEASIRYQVCEKSCLPPKSAEFLIGHVIQTSEPWVAPEIPIGASATSTETTNGSTTVADAHEAGLIPFLLTAFVAGLAALLTPCVFPMVPITVSFFLKQSEAQHHRPIRMATIYCLGIILTFTALGLLMAILFGATFLNQLSNHPWLNLFIAGILVFFGLNLLGMFELRIPSSLLTWSSQKESQGGVLGVLFMALTFTLVSFTCTFAFAGALLVLAANGSYYWPVLGMLSFATAFSLPFFFLALFPSFLRKLPKSGGWMNTIKVTMGMIEIGAAFKFLSTADMAWNPVPVVFDYSLVMTGWLVLCLMTGMYLLGVFRLPHDSPADNISVPRFMFAVLFIGFGTYLGVGLFAPQKPTGKLWGQIAAFAPPVFNDVGNDAFGPFLEHDGLRYALSFEEARAYAVNEGQPMFLDFTGVNCVNCRLMEQRVLSQPRNHELLNEFVRVQLYTDNVPGIKDKQLVTRLLAMNRDLQENWFGDVSLPAYAVVSPDGQTVFSSFIGTDDESSVRFTQFLNDGLAKWRSVSSQQTARSESPVHASR